MARTFVPLNTSTDQPSRRALLGALTAAGAASVVPAEALAGEQDPHLAWWAEHQRLDALSLEVAMGPDFEALLSDQFDLIGRIATTPAATAAGVLAQALVVRLGMEMGESQFDRDALENALATLERLAGRA